jgi:hypothetical protein
MRSGCHALTCESMLTRVAGCHGLLPVHRAEDEEGVSVPMKLARADLEFEADGKGAEDMVGLAHPTRHALAIASGKRSVTRGDNPCEL